VWGSEFAIRAAMSLSHSGPSHSTIERIRTHTPSPYPTFYRFTYQCPPALSHLYLRLPSPHHSTSARTPHNSFTLARVYGDAGRCVDVSWEFSRDRARGRALSSRRRSSTRVVPANAEAAAQRDAAEEWRGARSSYDLLSSAVDRTSSRLGS